MWPAQALIDHLYQKKVGGLYVTGSTGEGIYLDFALRRKLVELCVTMSKGLGTVVVHVGAIQASQAYELAAHAAKVGADAVSSIPPFVGGFSWDEIHAYYRRLCECEPVAGCGVLHTSAYGTNLADQQAGNARRIAEPGWVQKHRH